nr:uncharacterized protein LOC113743697 isoform X2 [Coffea arabica]
MAEPQRERNLFREVYENSFNNLFRLLPPVSDHVLTPIFDFACSTKFVIESLAMFFYIAYFSFFLHLCLVVFLPWNLKAGGTAWIRGEVRVWLRMDRLWFLACPHCHQPYDFADTLGIVCKCCGREMYIFPRYSCSIVLLLLFVHDVGLALCMIAVDCRVYIALSIKDDSDSMNILVIGDEAVRLIGLTAFHLYALDEQDVV